MGKCATPMPSISHGFSRGPTSNAAPCAECPNVPGAVSSRWKAAREADSSKPRKIVRNVNGRPPFEQLYEVRGGEFPIRRTVGQVWQPGWQPAADWKSAPIPARISSPLIGENRPPAPLDLPLTSHSDNLA